MHMTLKEIQEKGILTKAKIQIINSKMKRKIIIGAKGSGKTVVPEVEIAMRFDHDDYFNAVGIRKYKDQASDKLARYFHNTVKMMEQFGIKFNTPFKKSQSKSYRLISKSNMTNNPVFEYTSLENPTSTDSMSPTNGGFFGIVMIDEVVDKKDAANPDKVMTDAMWEESMEIIYDNLERYNFNYNKSKHRNEETTTYILSNPWGNHPILNYVNDKIPIDNFLNWVFQVDQIKDISEWKELLSNSIVNDLFDDEKYTDELVRRNTYNKEFPVDNTFISLMTKFANPASWEDNKRIDLLNKIKRSLLTGNVNRLTILLGATYEGQTDSDMLVYNLKKKDIPTRTFEDMWNDGYRRISKLTFSVDIDTSRVYTVSPTIIFQKPVNIFNPKEGVKERIFVDKQWEIKANGLGEDGELITVYVDVIAHRMTDYYNNLLNNYDKPKSVSLSLDDKRRQFMPYFKQKQLYFLDKVQIFKQHGDNYSIAARQDLTIQGFNHKVIYIHPKNERLIKDFQKVVKKKVNEPERNTEGRINYLDRIDSFENGWIRDRMIIKRIIGGRRV